MHLAYTPEQDALRQELREYFAGIVTPEVAEEMSRGDMGGPPAWKRCARWAATTGWP